jgi:hypothetical protein
MTSAGKTCLRIALFALAASTAAEAQRPGMGTFGRGRGPGKLTMAPGIDVPKPVNVINLMIENRATVALTDSQFIHVIAIKRELDSTNAPMFRRIDSVQRLFKPGPVFRRPVAATARLARVRSRGGA